MKIKLPGTPDPLTEAERHVSSMTRTIGHWPPEIAKRLLSLHAELLTAIARRQRQQEGRR